MNEEIRKELSKGGNWLGAARKWLQWNVKGGDTLSWNSTDDVSIQFNKFEELALVVATAAVAEDRKNRKSIQPDPITGDISESELHRMFNSVIKTKNIPKGMTECNLMDFNEFKALIQELNKLRGV